MNVQININGKEEIIDVKSNDTLLTVLRRKNIISVKDGCEQGCCGSCTVLLDDKPVASCIISPLIIKDCNVVTLEYFEQTEEYKDIIKGFNQAGIHLCGYCNAGKIFAAHDILNWHQRPTKEELTNILSQFSCPCTDSITLANGIWYAIANKHKRENKRDKNEI